MKVAILTQYQKDLLSGQKFSPDSYFSPIQDIDDNWVISLEEISQCINPSFWWIKDLEIIDFNKKESLFFQQNMGEA
jgi:hypothetical protein